VRAVERAAVADERAVLVRTFTDSSLTASHSPPVPCVYSSRLLVTGVLRELP